MGLTATCLGLVRALDRQGVRVGFYKPVAQPRAGDLGPERSTTLIRLATELDPPEPISVARLESLLSTGALDDVMEEVVEHGDEVLPNYDVVIVEGMVPSPEQTYSSRVNLAMAKALDASVVLVGAPGPRGLADVDEAMAIAADTYRSGEDVRVLGCVVNRLPDDGPETISLVRKALSRHQLTLVGAVPFTPELSRPRVLDLARTIGAQALHEGEWATRRVADVAVCAQSVPGALGALKDDWLVLTPGDRHDVIMAVCLAALNGTRLAGLLLTVEEPHPDVWALTAAAAASGLPILLTRAPTHETAVQVHDFNPEVAADDIQRAAAVMRAVADHIDEEWVRGLTTAASIRRRLSPAAFRHRIVRLAQQADRLIVLPEGNEPRTVAAAAVYAERGIARCLLLASPEEARAEARTLPDAVQVLDPAGLVERYVDALVEVRRGKGLTEDAAREQLADTVVLGTMMLHQGHVDGLVSGAVHTPTRRCSPPDSTSVGTVILGEAVGGFVREQGVQGPLDGFGGRLVREGQRLVDDHADRPVLVGPGGVDPHQKRLQEGPLAGRELRHPAPRLEHSAQVCIWAGPRADQDETADELGTPHGQLLGDDAPAREARDVRGRDVDRAEHLGGVVGQGGHREGLRG